MSFNFNQQLVVAGLTLVLLLTSQYPGAEAATMTTAAAALCETQIGWSVCKADWMCAGLCVYMGGYTGGYCSTKTNQHVGIAWGGFHMCVCTKVCDGAPPPAPPVVSPPANQPLPATPLVPPPEKQPPPAAASGGRKGMLN